MDSVTHIRHSGEDRDRVVSSPRWIWIPVFAGMMVVSGCTVGPDYHMPDLGLPQSWLSQSAPVDQNAAIEQDWWEHFHDPVLGQLIGKALSGNLDIKMAEARIEQARAARASARSDLLPSVNATGNFERQGNRLAFPGSGPSPFDLTKPFSTYQTGFDASWELDIWGGTRREIESEAALLSAAEASRDALRVSLLAEVARNYVDIRQYQAQIAIARDTIKADQDMVRIARERFKAGETPSLDVTQGQAQLDEAQTQLPYYQNLLAQAQFAMDVLLGEPPGATQKITAEAKPIPVSDKDLVLAAPAAVIANRPDIRVAERQLASATAQQGVAVAQFFPKISLSGFFGLLNTNYSQLLTAGSKSWDTGAGVLWPILNVGKLSAGLDAANARQQEALANYRKTVISALSDVERAVTAYSKQEEFRTRLAKAVADNRHAAAIARQRYKEGLSSFLDVLDAQRSLYTTQSQLAAADGLASQNVIAVYKSLGGGWKEKPTDAKDGPVL